MVSFKGQFKILIIFVVSLIAPTASLQKMQNSVVWLTCLRDSMLTERPRQAEQLAQGNLMRFNESKCKVCNWVLATPARGCKDGAQPC